MTDFWETVVNFAENTVDLVGDRLLVDFGQVSASQKADGTLVTQADTWSDRVISDRITEDFSDHGVLSEEGDRTYRDREWTWVIDPVDGTTNFARGIPLWGISLALLYRGTPVFGYVDFPPIQQTFKGFWYGDSGLTGPEGAFCNDRRLKPRDDDPDFNQFFSFCSRSIRWVKHPFPCKLRMMGVASYNLLSVPAGVGLGAIEATPKVWDIAGVWAIAKAAGAAWIPLDGKSPFPLQSGVDYTTQSFPTLLAARSKLETAFLEALERDR